MPRNEQLPRVGITTDMIGHVREFTEEVLDETYDRFNKDRRTRFERIFVGKLGELAFSTYLHNLGVEHDTTGMFEVYPGTTNIDPFDFVIPSTGETVDIKTAYHHFHTRILIPYGPRGQWSQMPKDYYVGLKPHNIADQNGIVDIDGELGPFAIIHGYVSRDDRAWQGPWDFGEGPCKWVFLERLRPTQELVERMRH